MQVLSAESLSERGDHLIIPRQRTPPLPSVRRSELREKPSRLGGCRYEKSLPEPPEYNRPGFSPTEGIRKRIPLCVVLRRKVVCLGFAFSSHPIVQQFFSSL